jgi:hypothetical protein
VRRASFLLYPSMRVRAVRTDEGRDLAFNQEVVAFTDFGKLQVNQVIVTLEPALARGGRIAIRLEYEGHLLGYSETGMRCIQDRTDPEITILRDDSHAYPRPGYPSVVAVPQAPRWSFTYSARIAIPRGLVVANGGRLEDAQERDGTVTYSFASIKPSWRMDFAIAKYSVVSAGPMRVYHLPGDEAGAVPDLFGTAKVDTFDLDPRMAQLAGTRLGSRGASCRVRVGDAGAIAVPDASYEAVVDFGIIHHVPAWRNVLGETRRVLRPGGVFFAEETFGSLIAHPLVPRLIEHPPQDRFDHATVAIALVGCGLQLVASGELCRAFGCFVARKGAASSALGDARA